MTSFCENLLLSSFCCQLLSLLRQLLHKRRDATELSHFYLTFHELRIATQWSTNLTLAFRNYGWFRIRQKISSNLSEICTTLQVYKQTFTIFKRGHATLYVIFHFHFPLDLFFSKLSRFSKLSHLNFRAKNQQYNM